MPDYTDSRLLPLLACTIHERFCRNRGFAAATSLRSAGSPLGPSTYCTKQDLYDIITEFCSKNPRARIPETAFPETHLLMETVNKIFDDMLELLNKYGLTSHQSMNLLERLGKIIEMGQR